MGHKTEEEATILVVEDDLLTIKLITAMLETKGYKIHAVVDGRQSLRAAKQSRPDLILMDVSMPDMDGIEACRQLKADPDLKQIPVVFITSNTDDEILGAAFNVGGSDYVRKPISKIELLARVHLAIDQQRSVIKLKEDEKLKGVLETAGGVCHELNQPLQYIMGAVQVLMLDMATEDPIYQKMEAICKRIEKMGDITRKLAEVTQYRSRVYAGGGRILDIEKCSQKVCENSDNSKTGN